MRRDAGGIALVIEAAEAVDNGDPRRRDAGGVKTVRRVAVVVVQVEPRGEAEEFRRCLLPPEPLREDRVDRGRQAAFMDDF